MNSIWVAMILCSYSPDHAPRILTGPWRIFYASEVVCYAAQIPDDQRGSILADCQTVCVEWK
jgi:hypothetical protein